MAIEFQNSSRFLGVADTPYILQRVLCKGIVIGKVVKQCGRMVTVHFAVSHFTISHFLTLTLTANPISNPKP